MTDDLSIAERLLAARVAFIGAGQMATALAAGFLRQGLIAAERITASDPSTASAERFSAATSARVVADNATAVADADVIFLSVKPQQMEGVCRGLALAIEHQPILVSIAAGVTLASLTQWFGHHAKLIRVMPNTPALVGAGASAYALSPGAKKSDGELVAELLGCIGIAMEVPEHLLDAVTGLSGSGPAFVYLVIEALSDGGVLSGLPRDLATRLAAQTVLGAAQMVLATGEHTGRLKDQVTSPGGTTIAGIAALERGGVRAALMSAVEAATQRARELASGNGK